FLRDAFKTLADGNILMMTGDGAGAGRFIGKFTEVEFLKKRVFFPTGAFSIAARTGACIHPVTIHRLKYDRYCVNIFEPLRESLDPKEKDFSKNAQEFASFLEDKIRSYPCHWHFWDDFVLGKLITEE
ncbi:hypothetical protein KKB18_12265, partial [bacterium]|nr:hypothetical protein [bacterium]